MADQTNDIERFIARWSHAGGSERANHQLFVTELCRLLDLPTPDPARDDTRDNAYVFERRITFAHGDGSSSAGFIDCYRRGAFVLEAKKVKAASHTKGFDDALMRARTQAENYARALPASEGRPPFLVVVDVGHVFELYAEFTRSGATYTPFPDAGSHRIRLGDLRNDAVRERLRRLWLAPMDLDPARASAKVTREVAARLAELAKSLEAAGHAPEKTAAFLSRCLFSMFAEDIGLLPKLDDGQGAFAGLLRRHRDDPATLGRMLAILWANMDVGGFSPVLASMVLRFNGKLFKGAAQEGYVLPLNREQIDGLLAAAQANWREVEPSIFGTLLERALSATDRHALGAHYTPRAYVERLVMPTVIDPLRAEWADVQAAALMLAREASALEAAAPSLPAARQADAGGMSKHAQALALRDEARASGFLAARTRHTAEVDAKWSEARQHIRAFHHRLCTLRVLDPACGSGNFLYVTLEHLKRLEAEVLAQLHALGEQNQGLAEFQGETVTPAQLLGIELNERAAAIAELVLWIGYLQWHVRSFGSASMAEPVIHDYGNIEHRDAVLAWDSQEPMRDAAGNLVTRWDGTSFKTHPVTGEEVPDETALVPQWRYINPRPAAWPQTDYIVGNPPFIGNKRMRDALGDGYVEALRQAWPAVPESADLVMYWWHHAAETVRTGNALRFGLITTNSISQTFNRRVLSLSMESGARPLSLVYAIPDHPWVDTAHGADVRIAMTVGAIGPAKGRLLRVTAEELGDDGAISVQLGERVGDVSPDLSTRLSKTSVRALQSNQGLSFMGVILVGDGFFLDDADDKTIRAIKREGVASTFVSGTDLQRRPRGRLVVDFTGMEEREARERAPHAYQWVLGRVKPIRLGNADKRFREVWWQFGAPRPVMRRAVFGLPRFIVTGRTARHRVFQFLDAGHVVESNAVVVALPSSFVLGVLSSFVHTAWAGWMGATLEDRPHYTNSTVFETFPFPGADTGLNSACSSLIGQIAEQIDGLRKAQLRAHAEPTITTVYNVLSKLRSGESMTETDRTVYQRGLVAVLRSLHDDLDTAVLEAYGWTDLCPALADHRPPAAEARAAAVETLLERLVALNAKRAAEEAAGTVRWLRPEFQASATAPEQTRIDTDDAEAVPAPAAAAAPVEKRPWPTGLPEQIKVVADVLAGTGRALTTEDLAARFTARGRWRDRLPTILDTLEALGRARRSDAGHWQGQ
jgi:hypothetical protein